MLALWVRERTREIAIRMALSAAPGHVLVGMVRQGMALVALGVAGGPAGALLLTRLIRKLLFEARPPTCHLRAGIGPAAGRHDGVYDSGAPRRGWTRKSRSATSEEIRMKRWIVTGGLILAAMALSGADSIDPDGPQFTAGGQLLRPRNYREWVFLTSGLGMTYGTPSPNPQTNLRFDNVFVTRTAYRSFLQSGQWPDQTMFVLEVRSSESNGSINKGGHYQSGLLAVEAEVKDEKRFPGKWGFFGFEPGAAQAKQIPTTASCYNCHSTNGAVDNTFVQFYPTLLDVARAKRTVKATPEGH